MHINPVNNGVWTIVQLCEEVGCRLKKYNPGKMRKWGIVGRAMCREGRSSRKISEAPIDEWKSSRWKCRSKGLGDFCLVAEAAGAEQPFFVFIPSSNRARKLLDGATRASTCGPKIYSNSMRPFPTSVYVRTCADTKITRKEGNRVAVR